MNVLPVIARELRSTSRQSATYWLRVGGAAAALFTIIFSALPALQGGYREAGFVIFSLIHRVVFFSIWLGVPWLVGDSISRERREGTLGLLFLTSLKPYEIVVAKTLVHGLRALTLWLAILPVMSLAFFLGGVGWREALLSVTVNLSALFLALAAGLLATSLCRQWLRAMVLATCLSVALMAFSFGMWGSVSATMIGMGARPVFINGMGWYAPGGGMPFLQQGTMISGMPMGMAGTPLAGLAAPVATWFGKTALSFAVLVGALILSAWQVRRVWQEVPPPIWMTRMNDYFCRPRYFQNFLNRWMKWQLDRNPIGWLEQRVWTSRLVVWAWFAVIVSIYSGVFSSASVYMGIFEPVQVILSAVLMLFVCASAAGSFRRERETGVMELLLVSPTTEFRIIGGRLRALWGRFLPAVALLVLIWIYFPRALGNHASPGKVIFLLTSFVALPVVGLYQSLRRQHFLSALLWTLAVGILLPFLSSLMLVGQYASVVTPRRGNPDWAYYEALQLTWAGVIQLGWALYCGLTLYRHLVERRFALDRTGE